MEFSTKFLGAAAMIVLAGLFYLPACKTEELNGDIMSALRGISERMNRLEDSLNTLKDAQDVKTDCLLSHLLVLDETAKLGNMKSLYDRTSIELLSKLNTTNEKVNSVETSISEISKGLITSFHTNHQEELESLNSLSKNLSSYFLGCDAKKNDVEFCNMEDTFANESLGLLAKMNMIQLKEDETYAAIRDLTNKVDNMQSNFTNTINDLSTNEMEPLKTTVFARLSAIETTLAANETEMAAQARQPAPSCQPEWEYFEGSCYYFSATSTNWSDGRKDCLERGADYAKITSAKELTFVSVHAIPSKYFWIGLNDMASEGTYRWVSDESLFSLHKNWWVVGEPNNFKSNEDCVNIYLAGLNDIPCTDSAPSYICEMAPTI